MTARPEKAGRVPPTIEEPNIRLQRTRRGGAPLNRALGAEMSMKSKLVVMTVWLIFDTFEN